MDLIYRIKSMNRNWKWVFIAVFLILVIIEAWMSDDAYHAFTMAKNLANGNGFVYNVGYRVNATTCPLYTLLVAVVYKIIGDMYLAALILNIFFSVSAFYLVISKICKNVIQMFLFTISIIGCYSFMCYTTSGLENSMLFFVGTIFVFLIEDTNINGKSKLLFTSLAIGILAFIRMDSVIVFSIVAVYIYFEEKNVKWMYKFLYGIVGMLPFIIWEVFSFVYYGYIFPNTMYVKLNTDFDKKDYIIRGFQYVRETLGVDVVIFAIIIIFIVISICKKEKYSEATAIGVILYCLYIVNIGGDFMVGRHFTFPFWVSYIYLMILLNNYDGQGLRVEFAWVFLVVIQVIWINTVQFKTIEFMDSELTKWEKTGIADEKGFYYQYTGIEEYLNNKVNNGEENTKYISLFEHEISEISDDAKGALLEGLPGMLAYYSLDHYSYYLTDRFGLMDPLLSKLPAKYEDNWRIGHMYRSIPEGYTESVETGYNRIVDPALHEYYDYVLKIVHDDVFSLDRMKVIIGMNKGDYDYLIDEYLNNDNLE